jgi:hypothetical protein
MSVPTASCLPSTKANEAVKYVIGMVLDFDPVNDCPLWLALIDKICMMMTRLACNRAIESSYWRMDNNSDVGLLTGYVLYWLPIELEFMDLDTFSR